MSGRGALGAIALAFVAAAGQAMTSSEAQKRTVAAARLAVPPKIDGTLDDPAWSSAAKLEGFWQWSPAEGAPATEKTVVSIGYDSRNLYVAFDVRDSSPSLVRASMAAREQIGDDDLVWISLDPFNDHRTGYEFICNPLGVQEDVFMTPSSWDTTFDTRWKSAGRLTPTGYVVEMAIPFRSLRFPRKDVQDWGIQFHRIIRRKNEHASWSPVFADRGHYFYQMGLIQGLQGIKPGGNLELIPEWTAFKSPGAHWGDNLGINAKYTPSPNVALDAAYKPDFSQIELDPVRPLTNLRFPVFIPEKRPFYMERSDIFATPIQVVNTRSIVTPYWGAKLAGKIDGSNVGLLYSRDNAASPNAGVYAARTNFDAGEDDTLGLVATDREQGGAFNRVGGVDGRFRRSEVYSATLQGIGSRALNADDSTQSGKAVYAQASRNTHTLETSLSYTDIDPSFRADVGFVPRVDIRNPAGSANYYVWTEQPWLTRWGPQAAYSRIYNHAGTLTDEVASAALYFEAPLWTSSLSVYPQNLEKFNGVAFRKNSAGASVSAAPSQYVNGGLAASAGDAIHYATPIELGRAINLSGSVNVKPWRWLRLESVLLKSELRERGSNALLSDQDTFRETVRVQCARELSLRGIADWTKIAAAQPPSSRVLTLSALAAYLIDPGTAAYVGYDVIRQSQGYGPWTLQDQTLFLKLSFLFRY